MLTWYRMLDKRPCQEWSLEDVARMRPKVDALIAKTSPGSIVCKTHNALLTSRGWSDHQSESDVRAIYIVRNPLDVASSFADFLGVDLDKAIEFMGTDNLRHRAILRSAMFRYCLEAGRSMSRAGQADPNRQLHVIRYEDLHEDPTRTLRRLARFLGLKPSRQRLAACNQAFVVQGHAGSGEETGFQGTLPLSATLLSAEARPGPGRTN